MVISHQQGLGLMERTSFLQLGEPISMVISHARFKLTTKNWECKKKQAIMVCGNYSYSYYLFIFSF